MEMKCIFIQFKHTHIKEQLSVRRDTENLMQYTNDSYPASAPTNMQIVGEEEKDGSI